jgi:hypothetical protein
MKGIVCFIAILLLTGTAMAVENPDAFVLSLYVGKVRVSHNNGKSWNSVKVEMPLKEKDTIKTWINSYCDILMPNRGNFRIVDNSLVSMNILKKQIEEIKVKKGRVLFNVSKKLSKGETFRVETDVAVASVRGTEFEMDTDSEKLHVSVSEGAVNVKRNVTIPEGVEVDEDLGKYLEVEVAGNQTIEMTQSENKALQNALNRAKNNKDELLKVLKGSKAQTEKKLQIMKRNIKRVFDELNQYDDSKSGSKKDDDTSETIGKAKQGLKK